MKRLLICCWLLAAPAAFAIELPPIFPLPQESQPVSGAFRLDGQTVIVLPARATPADRALARLLAAELSDRFGLAIRTEQHPVLPSGRKFILLGSLQNALIRQYCQREKLALDAPESYWLIAGPGGAVVAGNDERGAFYGLQSLRRLLRKRDGAVEIEGARVHDWPNKPFRGVKLYLPGRENIAYFKRFVRNFAALFKYNTIVLELNAAMRFDRHPELNAGWRDFAMALNYSRRERPRGPGMQFQDSAHHDTGDGGVLEKSEVADLVRFAREYHIEIIPEIPSLTHSYYLLTRHRELAEIPNAEWPDTYCPSNPKSYDLLFDVLDEYIEVMKPRMIHVGHDEWRMPAGVCPRCKDKDPRELFAQDLRKIHDHLKAKGVQTAIWGDHLIEDLRGERLRKVVSPTGYVYYAPGGLTAEQVRALIPKDILVFNWFWWDGQPGQGQFADRKLSDWGFSQVYGNMKPALPNYGARSSLRGVLGGAPSSWAATTEFNIGKDQLYDFTGCANTLWSRNWPDERKLTRIVQALMPEIRRNLSGQSLPSENGEPVVPVDISAYYNATSTSQAQIGDRLKAGQFAGRNALFRAAKDGGILAGDLAGIPQAATGIRIGEDASSLIFLHACAKPAANAKVDAYVYNAPDTADLLGWYEVLYEDGLVETIPLRYGVNILDWNWGAEPGPGRYAYRAEAVDCGATLSCFAFEWVNPRFGKVIREVNLKVSEGFKSARAGTLSGNPILLRAISKVPKRATPDVPTTPALDFK